MADLAGAAAMVALATVGCAALLLGCTEQVPLPPNGLISGTGGSTRGPRGGESGSSGHSGGGEGGQGAGQGGGDASGSETNWSNCDDLSDVRQMNPQIVIALDRSSSMGKKYGTATLTRLQMVQETLRSLMKMYQESIQFGYTEFPVKENCAANTCCASQIIPPNPRALSVIEKKWVCELGTPACSETTADSPVVEAFRQARWFFVDERVGPSRHVLLLTDGEPVCAFNKDHTDCSLALAQVSRLASESHVTTRVFGLAEELRASSCLYMMAALGSPSGSGEPVAGHRITLTGDQLYDELLRWFEPLSKEACTFRLPYGVPMGERLAIVWDGKALPRDPRREDGWEFNPGSARQVTFYGPACERLRAGTAINEPEFATCPVP